MSNRVCVSLIYSMKHGIVTRNVSDLRAKPQFRSERKSQVLFGRVVTISKQKDGYFYIHLDDGYDGWVDERAVRTFSRAKAAEFKANCNYIVKALTARMIGLNADADGLPPYVFLGTRLDITKRKGHLAYVAAPGGGKLSISLGNIVPMDNEPERNAGPILADARRFLGTPYLWGGVTPFGIDCSGLVQLVYGRHGIKLPRDSHDQMKSGERIGRAEIQAGDLLFFKGHVAIALDGERIIHASLAEGGVAVNSLNPEHPRFRRDLYDGFLEARRVL